jgi:hypothetical protein
MSVDPHQLHPDHLPTPFSADEIRLGCQPGRTIRSLVVEPGREPIIRVTRFVSADDEGAEQDSWHESLDGLSLTEPVRRRSTWVDFQGHASFPAATTECADDAIDIPAGRYDCLRYTNRDGDLVRMFWFAISAPGMPLQFEERVGGEIVYSSTAIENVPAPDPGPP